MLTEELELAFEDTVDYSKFMVHIKPKDVSKLKKILKSISSREIRMMQAEMERVWRLFSYGHNGLAPYMILDALASRKSPYHLQRNYITQT